MNTSGDERPKAFYQRETRSLNGTVKRTTAAQAQIERKEKVAPPPKKQLLKVKMTRPLYKDLIAARNGECEETPLEISPSPPPSATTPSSTPRQSAPEASKPITPIKSSPVLAKQTPSPKASPLKQQPIPACEIPSSEVEITIEQTPLELLPETQIQFEQNSNNLGDIIMNETEKSINEQNEPTIDKTINEQKSKIPTLHLSKSMIEPRDLNPGTRRTSGVIGTGKESNLFGRPRKDTLVYDEKHPLTIEQVVGCELHWRGLKIAAKVVERSNASDLIEHFEIWKFKNAAREMYRYFSSLPNNEYSKYSRKERMKVFLDEVMAYKD